MSSVGPLNGTTWVAHEILINDWDFAQLGSVVFGFIGLTAGDQLDYIADDQAIARYHPDPEAETGFCY